MIFPLKTLQTGLALLIFFLSGSGGVWAAGNDNASLAQGLEFFQAGKYEESLKAFDALLQKEPSNALARYYLGLNLNKLEKFNEAIAAFEKALELNPQLKEARLSLGIAYYKIKSLDPALQALSAAVDAEPGNGPAHFFLGLVHKEKGEHQRAVDRFKKAGELDRDLYQLSLYNMALAYEKMGRIDEAREAAARAAEVDRRSGVARDSLALLEGLGGKSGKPKRWKFDASAGWQYDDNVTRVEQDTVTGKSDSAGVFEFNGSYKLIDGPRYGLEVDYDLFQSVYDESTNFDFQSHGATIAGSRDAQGWDAGMDYSYNYSTLGGVNFLETHTLRPSFGFSGMENFYVGASYLFQDKNFLRLPSRDAANHSFGIDNFFFFMDSKAYVLFGYRFDREDAAGPEFDYFGHLFSGGVQLPLPLDSKARIAYKYNLRDYEHITPSIGEERRDDKQTLKLTLTKKVFPFLSLKMDYEHIISDSNLSSVDFTQNVVFLGLVFSQ
ncbi:MAG: tetratricopeptide repeat protein [Nitrospinae bacterium]|nr:tetratricopeptide repeat protein [Nitrospinota bacterium]